MKSGVLNSYFLQEIDSPKKFEQLKLYHRERHCMLIDDDKYAFYSVGLIFLSFFI